MYKIDFSKTKNDSLTCSVNGSYLHSSYNPQKEAERFVENIKPSFKIKDIIIIEPAIPYCIDFLKKRFPDAKLYALRFTKNFDDYNKNFHKVFYFFEETTTANLEWQLLNFFCENLCYVFFEIWPASKKVFYTQCEKSLNAIRNAISTAKTILITRSYFSKRWLLNSISYCKNIKRTFMIKSGEQDIVITASGPSLKNTLPAIKKNRNKIFLIALSSAVQILISNDIFPDLVISTDGGYWAKKHIEILAKYPEIPLFLPPDGACPKKILEKSKIIPMSYTDGFETVIAQKTGFIMIPCERNGTVSGTAADFALKLTSGKIFFCGLDLSPGIGYQHCQPNKLETINSNSDYRLKPKENRSIKAIFNSSSLKIYEQWFSARDKGFYSRIYRLSNNYIYSNKLGNMNDVNTDFFEKSISNSKQKRKIQIIETENRFSCTSRQKIIIEEIEKTSNEIKWLEYVLPVEYTAYIHALEDQDQCIKRKRLDKKNTELIQRLIKEAKK